MHGQTHKQIDDTDHCTHAFTTARESIYVSNYTLGSFTC